ncbi:MAG: hypothetical protein ACK55E_03760 [Cyanobacteriota bacterium]
MTTPRWSMLLAAVLAMPVPAPVLALQSPPASPGGGTDAEASQWLARERRGKRQAHTGFGRSPRNLQRGNRRPSGGWSRRINADGGRRSLDRARRDWDRNRIGDRVDRLERRDWDRDWDRVRDRYDDRLDHARDRVRDDWRDVRGDVRDAGRRLERAVNRWDDQWPGWVRPGWALARPWGWGWYGTGAAPSWGWWGTRSVAWGLGSLATASVINAAVNQALAASRTTIQVPDSGYTLYYNSITSTGTDTISFSAACQVAYGPAEEAVEPGRNRTDRAPASNSTSGASPQRV